MDRCRCTVLPCAHAAALQPAPLAPLWVPLVILVPTLLWGLAFLLVPFSVIGVKSRLDGLEARLDEIQAEIPHLGAAPS